MNAYVEACDRYGGCTRSLTHQLRTALSIKGVGTCAGSIYARAVQIGVVQGLRLVLRQTRTRRWEACVNAERLQHRWNAPHLGRVVGLHAPTSLSFGLWLVRRGKLLGYRAFVHGLVNAQPV